MNATWTTGTDRTRSRRAFGSRPWSAVLACGLLLLLASCQRYGGSSEGDRNPAYQKAKQLQEQHDYQGAADWYEKALQDDPRLASAHLALGLLCDDKLGDPIAAIYHYQQYLKLRPGSEKQQLVADFIERAKLSLASKLPQSPVIDPAVLSRMQTERESLIQENQMLKARVAELEKQSGAPPMRSAAPPSPAAPVAAAPAPAAGPSSEPPAAGPGRAVEASRARSHVVQKGDTLYSLALHYYGTRSGWEKIYQANRNLLANKDQLKVGQELVIP